MSFSINLALFVQIFANYEFVSAATTPTVPAELWSCYRSEGPKINAPHRLDGFLSVLKKLEDYKPHMDMRRFSVALLRSFRLDGIEQSETPIENQYNIPYRATAFQFQKFKLLMDLFLPGNSLNVTDEELTEYEKCYMHRMLSATVDRWERGDENIVCPMSMSDQKTEQQPRHSANQRGLSRCPIERGVIQTEFGSVAIGTVVAAIAAALEHQTVLITDLINEKKEFIEKTELEELDIESLDEIASTPTASVDNLWIATLSGDLAEIAVNQGPRVGAVAQSFQIGTNYAWNDTFLPIDQYILVQNESFSSWHLTDSEILAGIDGLILAHEVDKWVEMRSSLKLSQIIDMYYSNFGVSFNRTIKACNRRQNFYSIFDKNEILEQVKNFGSLLSLSQGSVVVSSEKYYEICEAVVEAFTSYLSVFFEKHNFSCDEQLKVNSPSMDLILTLDGTWKSFETMQFASEFMKFFGISLSDSSIGFIHGGSGHWIIQDAGNVTTAFSDMQSFTGEWPNRLNFPTILTQLNIYMTSKSNTSARSHVTLPTVVAVVTPTYRLTENEMQQSRQLLSSMRRNHLDIYFVFIAQDLSGYKTCTEIYNEDIYDFFIQITSNSVTDILNEIKAAAYDLQIPRMIVPSNCNTNTTSVTNTSENILPFQGYVLPGKQNYFRVNSIYLKDSEPAVIQFKTFGGGQIKVCTSCDQTATVPDCKLLEIRESIKFNVTKECSSRQTFFTIEGITTTNECVSNHCRLPYQIDYSVEQNGLQCLNKQEKLKIRRFHMLLISLLAYVSNINIY